MLETTLFLAIVEPRIFIMKRRLAVLLYCLCSLANGGKAGLMVYAYFWLASGEGCGEGLEGLEASRVGLGAVYYGTVNFVVLWSVGRCLLGGGGGGGRRSGAKGAEVEAARGRRRGGLGGFVDDER